MIRKAPAMLLTISLASIAGSQESVPSRASEKVTEGRAALRNDDTDKAVQLFQGALVIEPNNVDAHTWLGRTYALQVATASFFRKPILASRAISEMDKAVALDPRNVEARVARTEFYMQAPGIAGGGIDKARAEAGIAKTLDPYRGGFLVARVAERAKNIVVADAEYRSLISAFPDSSGPAAGLASFLENQGRWSDAFTLIDGELARAPANPDMLYQLGRAAALSGQRLDDGEAALHRYLARPLPHEGNDASAHWRLGRILEQRGDLARAREEYVTTIKLDPRNDDAKRALDRLGHR